MILWYYDVASSLDFTFVGHWHTLHDVWCLHVEEAMLTYWMRYQQSAGKTGVEHPASLFLEQRLLLYGLWKTASSHLCEQDLWYCPWTRLQRFVGGQDQCCFLGFAIQRLWASTSDADKQVLQGENHHRATSDATPIIVKRLYPRRQTLQMYRKPKKNTTNEIITHVRKICEETLQHFWVRKSRTFWKHSISRKFWIPAFLEIKTFLCSAFSKSAKMLWFFFFSLSLFACCSKLSKSRIY